MDKRYAGVLSICFIVLAAFTVWITYVQDTAESNAAPTEEVSTPTPTAEPVVIEYVDDLPVAVAFSATPAPRPTATPTFTPTVTPTVTPQPTPTATTRPTERVSAPKPTNTPAPTKTPAKTTITPYPVGKVGTQYTDDPDGHVWKPYARYQKITKKGSAEYRLREKEVTAQNGLRVVKDPYGVWRYAIALEPQWAGGQSVDIGRCIDIQMTNGAVLHCVLADCKTHERSQNKEGRYGSQGELLEFIADQQKLSQKVIDKGDVSYCGPEFIGGVVSITVLDYYIEGFGR